MTRQGTVEASTREGADASLLEKPVAGRLASADSLRTAARVCLACILSADKAQSDLGTFAFFTSHLLSTAGRNTSAVAEILRLIERLEEIHTEVKGMIINPHLVTILL